MVELRLLHILYNRTFENLLWFGSYRPEEHFLKGSSINCILQIH